MSEERSEQTRIRINYKVSAKGLLQPDITSEAETVDTANEKSRQGYKLKSKKWAVDSGYKTEVE